MMGFAEFIIGPAEGRTRWLYPSYNSSTLPVGQISKKLSSPRAKNIPLSPSGKSSL
jgi:hypothetical protein